MDRPLPALDVRFGAMECCTPSKPNEECSGLGLDSVRMRTSWLLTNTACLCLLNAAYRLQNLWTARAAFSWPRGASVVAASPMGLAAPEAASNIHASNPTG